MKLLRIVTALTLSSCLSAPAWSQAAGGEVVVAVGESEILPVQGFPKHEVIAADKIEVEVEKDRLVIRGRELGQATLILWDEQGRPRRYAVKVVPPGEVAHQRERDIRAALAADSVTKGAAIEVTVSGSQAVLTGTVDRQEVAARAVSLARSRVREVVSNLEVKRPGGAPAPPPAGSGSGEVLPPIVPPERVPGPVVQIPDRLRLRIDDTQQLERLEMVVNEARLITVPTELRRALIAEENIADVVPIPPREVAVVAKEPGDTTLMIWYEGSDPFLREVENARIDLHVVAAPEEAEGAAGIPSSEDIDRMLKLLHIEGIKILTSADAQSPSVLLLGTVANTLQRQRAEEGIRAVFPENVRITNLVDIERPPAMSQAELSKRAAQLEKLLAEDIPNASIRVRTRTDPDGERIRVYLSGEAAVPRDRLRAEQLVTFELGDRAVVTNDIVTPLPPPPGELGIGPNGGTEAGPRPPLSEAIFSALAASGINHDRVYIDVYEDRKVVAVRGTVRNDDDQTDVTDLITNVVSTYDPEYEVRDRGLSVRTPRIVTEVEIVELSALDLRNLGVLWGTAISSQSGGGGGGSTQGATQIDNSNGNLTVFGERVPEGVFRRLDPVAASIRALVQENRGRVLQQPNITCDDGQQGLVEIVTEVPLPSTTTGTGGTTGTSVEFRPVGIRLQVTPTVLWGEPDNRIEMDIQTEVSAVDFGIAINIGGSVIPAITNRQAETIVTVDDRETLVIGGLTTETERKNVSRLPFLSDLPIIGALFRHTENRKDQTTVVIVMTPRIQW